MKGFSKRVGPDSLGVLLEDTMQELLTGIIFQLFLVSHYPCLPFFHTYSYLYYHFYHFTSTSFPLLSGFKSIRTCCPSGGKSGST